LGNRPRRAIDSETDQRRLQRPKQDGETTFNISRFSTPGGTRRAERLDLRRPRP
jgi:hypothetical protein